MEDDVGNRFHPTEEQIILYYLEGKMQGNDFSNVIGVIDICKFEPWDLPERAAWQSNDPAWYFFSEPDYKYAKSTRFNRRTKAGYWKPTGKDRPIRDRYGRDIGIKKNLVFYQGCSNHGAKTNWVMHEYHSLNAHSYQKPYVLYRLKQKSDDDGSDTCDGPIASHDQMASQNHPSAQGPSYSTGSNNEPNAWRAHNSASYTSKQDEFVNSLLADQQEAYSFEETVNTRRHDFNPPKSLRRVYAGDTSYTDAETADSQQLNNVPETPTFLSGNTISKEDMQIRRVQAPQLKKPPINCIRLLSEGLPVETRTCKAQRLPRSHNIEKKSAPVKLCVQGKISNKAESREEVRRGAKLVTDLPWMKNSVVKCVNDHGIGRSSGKTSWKRRSDGSDCSRKDYIIFLDIPPFGHKPNPRSVYVGNILIAVVLFMFIIREMESLH